MSTGKNDPLTERMTKQMKVTNLFRYGAHFSLQ
uniref:Uncharacterized protein n=1 Tax=Anguilla anguilla TaxID=7936 RepID=A0A0E9WFD0_ANGAN